MLTKTCSKCKQTRSVTSFRKRKANQDGYNGFCKLCHSDYEKNHYSNQSEIIKQQRRTSNKSYADRNRAYILQYKLNHGCKYCPEKEPCCLDFHHLDSKTKLACVSQLVNGFSIDKLIAEIDKCDVVCANCHRKITNKIPL